MEFSSNNNGFICLFVFVVFCLFFVVLFCFVFVFVCLFLLKFLINHGIG